MRHTVPLPRGWVEARLGDIASVLRGVTYKGSDAAYSPGPDLLPLLRATNIDRELTFSDLVYVPSDVVKSEQLLLPGDIVVAASSGSINVVGKAAPLRHAWRGTFGAFCFALRPTPTLATPLYLSHFLQTTQYRSAVSRLAAGVNINNLRREHVEQMPLPLAPSAEQRRIVDAIESYLTRLDNAVALLERVEENLKRYRASVLKAAVEGRLVPTEAALACQEGREYEPASEPLKRILVERKARWIEDAAEKARAKAEEKARKAGQPWTAKDDAAILEKERAKAAKQYKEPAAPNTSDLPDLPEGWGWATVDAISEVQGGLAKGHRWRRSDELREVPYLRVANVQRGYLDLAEMKMIEATEDVIATLTLRAGDVLFNEGGDRDKLGRGWVWEGQIPECIHQNHVFRARVISAAIMPQLLSWYANTKGQEYFVGQGKQTTNLASISMTKLKSLPIPIPPPAEQRRIVAELEAVLSSSDALVSAVGVSRKRCTRLRQSILKWAFEGKLVEQDPADEPASALLERVRAARAEAKGWPRR